MRELIEKITNGRYTEPLVKNEKYEVLFQKGINIDRYHIYRKEENDSIHILNVDVYPHEKVEIVTFVSWGCPEVEEVKDIVKELFGDLRIFLKTEIIK